MAPERRTTTDPLGFEAELAEEPYRHGFYATLRRVECAQKTKPRVGAARRASDESLRLGQDPSLAFAPSTVSSFEATGMGGLPRLGVYFLGLFGPNGPLPLHLTEYAHGRLVNDKDATFARFADIFHHRILSLFYRAWAQAQPTVSLDRPEEDRFGVYVASLLGVGTPALRERDAAPDLSKLFYCGHYSGQTRNADGLAGILEDFFESPVAIRECLGDWYFVPARNRARLNHADEAVTLGEMAILGERRWEPQLRFRIVLGPVHLDTYQRLLPGGESLDRLRALVRHYVGEELLWDLEVVLASEDVPEFTLGGEQRLGLTSWLSGPSSGRSSDHLHIDPMRRPAPASRQTRVPRKPHTESA